MSMRPQDVRPKVTGRRRSNGIPPGASRSASERFAPIAVRKLQDALRSGVNAGRLLWSFMAKDWIAEVHAADIDNDGDIEVLVGSRDGYVRALTRWGAVKWEFLFDGQHISALYAIPQHKVTSYGEARIIVGTRSGKVFALDKSGEMLSNWVYDTGRMIRQIFISEQNPEQAIIGSEDRCIHILNSATGRPLCPKYSTDGWVRCVFSCDIDGDGKDEILGGSGDKHLYILSNEGDLLAKLYIGHQVYALSAAQLWGEGPLTIITSSNRKDLTAWAVTKQSSKRWRHKKLWKRTPEENLFQNRVHAITIADINHDCYQELLVGSEDGHLYVLDWQGELLWKHHLGSCVYSVFASDLNFDGKVEVLVGTEDRRVYVLHFDFANHLYQTILHALQVVRNTHPTFEISRGLSPTERELLKDFTGNASSSHHPRKELEEALQWMSEHEYEKALAILLRLLQQKVQYYWEQPVTTKGYIWTENYGNVSDGPTLEIIAGTDEGYIYAIDIEQDINRILWEKHLSDRVRMLQTGLRDPSGYDAVVAVLANHRLVVLDSRGEITKELTFEDKQDWARSVSLYTTPGSAVSDEVIIGQENNKVSIWTANLDRPVQTITTPQGIGVVYAADVNNDGVEEIICGSLHNQVYVYTRQGEQLWHFDTQGRIQSLCAVDIDKDGQVEVIVGSEDRYVYALDSNGHLKWQYRVMRGVMDVDVCDIKLENDPEDVQERKWKILVSSADSYLYMLNAEGDLVWKYKSNNRVRSVRARDLNYDGMYEIAVASENQIELLQILNRKELINYMDECWEHLTDGENYREKLIQLTYHQDEFIRGYAIAKLAGQRSRQPEDFKRLEEALNNDDALQVRRELVRSIAVLSLVTSHHEDNIRQARQLLQQLSVSQEEEIRLAIVDILPLIDDNLCFDYLERFTHNDNIWVRRAVVRQLDKLVDAHYERAFQLLLKMAEDEEAWIRQETGRVLAHYFDTHIQLLVRDLLALLYRRVEPELLLQISYSSRVPAVAHLFSVLVKLLTGLDAENIGAMLHEAINTIEEANRLGPFYGEELLQVYEEFRQIFRAKSISAIAGYQRITRPDLIMDFPSTRNSSPGQIMNVFDGLQDVVQAVKLYERRDAIGDRASSLIDAIEILDSIRNELSEGEARQTHQLAGSYRLPENAILSHLLAQWSKVIRGELFRLRGDARLVAEIRNKRVPPEEEIVISLRISNHGRSPADNVQVILEESEEFAIIGDSKRLVAEISTNVPVNVDFRLKLHVTSTRLSFKIVYDDAEKRAKQTAFADIIAVQAHERPYRLIPNPYTSGTPIREKGMFYGRKEDIASLLEKLSSVSANRVVVLSGLRRMGKTSLIYQLAGELARGPYAPILVDLQALALVSNVGQFLRGIAIRIYEEIWNYKGVRVIEPDAGAFNDNPTSAFDAYLSSVLDALPDVRLVFLLDEFERLQEQIQQGKLDQDILNYLRSLMQHRQRLNFLLAGAPAIDSVTEGYWAVFFNIALRHRLTKLKPDEATNLITQPVSGFLEYDPLALERVRQLTGDQPYLIHVISEQLIAYCNRYRKPYVTINDVNAVLDIVIDEQASSIRWIWDQAKPQERLLLSILALEKGEEGRVFSWNDIWAEYDVQGIPYSRKEVAVAIQNLVREDIVEERQNGTQFRIPVGLTKEWLRRAKPPERVIREELLTDD